MTNERLMTRYNVTGTSLVVSSMPLAMELAMELCYPASEGVVGGFISIWFNISTVVFLSLFNIPGIGISWLDYVLPAACVLAIPFILPVKVGLNMLPKIGRKICVLIRKKCWKLGFLSEILILDMESIWSSFWVKWESIWARVREVLTLD